MIAALMVALLVGGVSDSPVTMARVATPEKALRFEVTVPASVDEVWTAFTTERGLATWLYSNVHVDLRPGGDWLVLYPGGKTGGGTIVSFDPGRRITLKALAPEQFPTVREQRTTAVFDFEPTADGKTRVILTQTGWRDGDEWNRAYDYLAEGNRMLLEQLHRRFVSGPLTWKTPAQDR